MRAIIVAACVGAGVGPGLTLAAEPERPPTRAEVEAEMGLRSEGDLVRGQLDTSLSEPELPVAQATRDAGLGKTAPSNLHHWVGYAAVGYSLAVGSP